MNAVLPWREVFKRHLATTSMSGKIPESSPRPGEYEGGGAGQESRLPRSLPEAGSPIEELSACLRAPDGAEKFQRLLDSAFLERVGLPAEDIRRGTVSSEALLAAKEAAKALLPPASSPEERMAITLAYLLSLASGLAHHGALLGSRDRRPELERIFTAMAATAPEPWSALFERAVKALKDREEGPGSK